MLAKLPQRHAFAGGRQQANVGDGLFRIAVRRLVAQHQVEALLALQYLAHGVAAHRRLNRVLHVGDVDLVTRGALAIDNHVQVRLADHAEHAQVLDALDAMHDGDDLIGFGFEQLQVVAEDLQREFALYAANRLLHVVGYGLGEVPDSRRESSQVRGSWPR